MSSLRYPGRVSTGGQGISSITRSQPKRRAGALQLMSVSFLCLGVITSSWNGLRAGPGLAVCDVFFVLATLTFVTSALLGNSPRKIAPGWLVVPAYALLGEVFFSGLAAGSGSILPGIEFVAAMLLTPLIIGLIAANCSALWLVVDCWIFSVAVNAAVGTSDYFAHTHIGESLTGVRNFERVAGLTTQSNHLAFACVFAMPILVARMMQSPSRSRKVSYLGISVLLVLALLGSGSRGGTVGAVFVLATTPFFQPAIRGRALKALAAGVVGVMLAATIISPSVSFVSVERLAGAQGVGVEGSDLQRGEARQLATEQFDSRPVYGVGFSTVRASSTVYLSLLAAGGVIALLAWLVFSFGAISASVRLARTSSVGPELSALSGAVCGTLCVWLILDFVENQLYDRYLFVPCGILIGCLVVASYRGCSVSVPAVSTAMGHDVVPFNVEVARS